MTAFNEFATLRRVALRSPAAAFSSEARIHRDWMALNFTAAPELSRANEQFAAFEAAIRSIGANVDFLPADDRLTLDAIYVRDASILTPKGIVLCAMGKHAREQEPAINGDAFARARLNIAGRIEAPGKIEGGDVVWFDEHTVAVGRGYRTNDEGIRQFAALVEAEVDIIIVPLPHYRGPTDVFHLMSILSPVDVDLAVVYSPLMPVPFREWLQHRSIQFVEVPDEEFDSMGANVLALAPRQCVMVERNPTTRARLEQAGARVTTYDGSEISAKGGGGPTCLTRPLVRG